MTDFKHCIGSCAVCLGSSTHDLASSAEGVSSLCLRRVAAGVHIPVLSRPSVIKVCVEIFSNVLYCCIL